MGVALLIMKVLAFFSGWNVRVETFFIGLFIFTSSILALFLKRKLFGKFEIYDAIIPFLFLNLYQYENLVWGFQIGFVLPLFWLLLAVYLFAFDNSLKRNLLLTLICFLSAYSHFHGIFVGVLIIFFFLIKNSFDKNKNIKAQMFMFMLLNILIVLSYFVGYKEVKYYGVHGLSLKEHVSYIIFQINGFWGNHSRNILSIFIPVISLLFFLNLLAAIRKVGLFLRNYPVISLFTFSFLFSVSTSLGRVGLGVDSGNTSRYLTLMIPLYLGIYFCLVRIKDQKLKNILIPFILVCFVFASSQNNFMNYRDAALRKEKLANWSTCYFENNDYYYCDKTLNMQTFHSPDKINLPGKLEYLKENRLNLFR